MPNCPRDLDRYTDMLIAFRVQTRLVLLRPHYCPEADTVSASHIRWLMLPSGISTRWMVELPGHFGELAQTGMYSIVLQQFPLNSTTLFSI